MSENHIHEVNGDINMEHEFVYQKILRILKQFDSLTSAEIAEKIPGSSEQSIAAQMTQLKIRGCVKVTGKVSRRGRGNGPMPMAYGLTGISYNETKPCYNLNKRMKRLKEEAVKKFSDIEILKLKISALEIWRKRAVERFPELSDDKQLTTARVAAAEILRSVDLRKRAELVEQGKRDYLPLVQDHLKLNQ